MSDSETPKTNGLNRAADRTAINRANAQKSTGPRTEAGKQRSSLNALRHGLTGHTIVLPSEDQSAYQRHSQSFLDEYRPKGATETHLVQSLIDTSWQLNRAAANIAIYRQRLTREFERTLVLLRQIQAERREK